MKNNRKVIFVLVTVMALLLGTVPVMAAEQPAADAAIKFSNEQIKLAQINWNFYLEWAKSHPGVYGGAAPLQATTINPDSVIGKAALINHFAIPYPDPVAAGALTNGIAYSNNPYFDYYPFYYCTYQYR